MVYNSPGEAMVMKDILPEIHSPLFEGVKPKDRKTMLGCIGYHIGTFKKGDIVAFEEENIKHIHYHFRCRGYGKGRPLGQQDHAGADAQG